MELYNGKMSDTNKIPYVDEEAEIGSRRESLLPKSSGHASNQISDTSLNREEARDHPGPLPDSTELRRRELRRNSISLPELNSIQMDALKKIHDDEENAMVMKMMFVLNIIKFYLLN